MSTESITFNDLGQAVLPLSQEDWVNWVSASATRNFMIGDPLTDWLNRHGEGAGFTKDDASHYDERIDFGRFVMAKGIAFEAAMVDHLRTMHPVITMSDGPSEVQDLKKAEDTFQALCAGQPIIHQGVLRDPESRTYGAPDFLIRSDILINLFPGSIDPEEAALAAPDLNGALWHYVVVDAKFTSLSLAANGTLANGGSKSAYKAQLFVYNRALGRLQGYLPELSFLLGRSWEQGSGANKQRGRSAMERLGPIPNDQQFGGLSLGGWVEQATEWVRRVRNDGGNWRPLPVPSVPELWPTGSSDYPWRAAKARIAEELSDLTQLWQVSPKKRDQAHESSLYSWRDPRCTAEALGVTGDTYGPRLQAILDVNQSDEGPAVMPAKVTVVQELWRKEPALEFYVDFETVSDLNDDFSKLPARGGQALIFMIGCGHMEDGEWRFASFVTDTLEEPNEARIIDGWFAHMDEVAGRLATDSKPPLVIHWSNAEESFLETAYNAAKARQPEKRWPSPTWFDFLSQVVRREPVVVRGSFGFGLKSVAKALRHQGLIETTWDDSPLDGMGAMVGAWRCAAEARETDVPINKIPLMREIAHYNEVDCKVMMEIVRYLRANH